MLRIIISIVLLNFYGNSFSQTTASIEKEQEIVEMRVDKNFGRKYSLQLHLLRRTYPLAIKARKLIDDYEKDLSRISKRRHQKKYGKEAQKALKDEFLYNIKDLYVSEGGLLMKLIHRETGMTVKEILKKYRGGFQTGIYSGTALIFGHDINSTYDANGDDWVTEVVIQDIESGRISFNKEMKRLDKQGYKESMKDYRESKKNIRKKVKAIKKKNQRKK